MKIISGMVDIDEGVAALCHIDPRLRAIVEKAGPVPLRLSEPGYAGLAHTVVSQMVSRASANAIWQRMLDGLGEVTARNFLEVDSDRLAGFGLSRAKIRTLHTLASAVDSGEVDLAALCHMEGEAALRALTGLSGIGPWTAQVYLMFCGGHADLFPTGDVALQAAVAHGLNLDGRPGSRELGEIASIWSPWRSVAARIFWAYYAAINRREALPIA